MIRQMPLGSRLIWFGIVVLLTIVPTLLALPAPVARAESSTCQPDVTRVFCMFMFTGATQSWVVPTGVTQATFNVYGAAGGGVPGQAPGGLGGRATATLPLTPGSTIWLFVGGRGADASCDVATSQGGFNGGGSSAMPDCGAGGGGGGASDVRIGGSELTDRMLVGGGGGGGQMPGINSTGVGWISAGGAGGGVNGLESGYITEGGYIYVSGGGQFCTPESPFGFGANGLSGMYAAGGGGGGGWCGGRGGLGSLESAHYATGGGGGSGHGPEGTVFDSGVREGNGLITILYDIPDLTPPTTSALYSNDYVPGVWTDDSVNVSLSATDNNHGSGVATIYYAINNPTCDASHLEACNTYTAPFTISSEGTTTLTFFSVDVAGNTETLQTASILIDRTGPDTSVVVSGTPGDNGWYTSDVTVTWNWTDTLSGIDASVCPATSSTTVDGTTPLVVTCYDQVGNVTTSSIAIQIDQTEPDAAPTLSGTQGANGWYTSDVTVIWNWSDATSGIDATGCPATTVASTAGEYEVLAECSDLAGNVASAGSAVRVDKAAPTITYGGNLGTYTVADEIDITCSVTDATSGIASTSCADISGPAASFGLGSHTFSATATDYAGHSSSESVTFTVSVEYASLADLTCQMLDQQASCSTLSYYLASAEWAEGRHIDGLQKHYLNFYARLVTALQNRGLTEQEAQTLLDLVQTLYPRPIRGR